MSLHGHTKIELKNEKTGVIQVVEKDNMITTSIQKLLDWISPYLSYNRLSYDNVTIFPLSSYGMGGIVLFKDTLSEDSTVTIPNKKVVAYASNDTNSGSDTKRGSKNLTESMKLDNGYKFVWDFSTSQGNGEISSLGLTSYKAGINAVTYSSINNLFIYSINEELPNVNSTIIKSFVDFDFDTDIFTSIIAPTTTTLTITKYKLNIGHSAIDINSTWGTLSIISQQTIDLSQSIPTNMGWVDGHDGYYYGVYLTNNKQITFVRINKTSYQLDTSYSQTITYDIYLSNDNVYLDNTATCKNFCILDNYLYMSGVNNFYRINLSNLTEIQSVTKARGVYDQGLVPDIDNHYIHACQAFIYSDFSINTRVARSEYFMPPYYNNNSYQHLGFIKDNKAIGFDSYGNRNYIKIGYFSNYLATINNLDTPITKTSDQNMKIIYTITEVEDK